MTTFGWQFDHFWVAKWSFLRQKLCGSTAKFSGSTAKLSVFTSVAHAKPAKTGISEGAKDVKMTIEA